VTRIDGFDDARLRDEHAAWRDAPDTRSAAEQLAEQRRVLECDLALARMFAKQWDSPMAQIARRNIAELERKLAGLSDTVVAGRGMAVAA
jgi:hypothetical protein